MNNLFIDLVSENSIKRKNYIDEILLKTIGFIFKEDKLLKTKNTTTMFLIFNMEVFLKTNRNLNILKKVLKKRIKIKRNLTIVFCKQFNTLPLIKKELLDLITMINQNNKCVESVNYLKQRDFRYIERYIYQNNIDKNKFKILIALNDINDLDIEKIKTYIEKYKFIDILKMKDVCKTQYKKMLKIIDDINNEYGTSIEIIQKRNIQNYDFYILYSKNLKHFFKAHYILNKNSYLLDITDIDDDVLSKEYKLYEKNKGYITTLFDRMCLSSENFCKTDLGSLYN